MYFNGEGIQLAHVTHASTDGDILVFFRSSDVIAAGDIYSTSAIRASTSRAAAASTASSKG